MKFADVTNATCSSAIATFASMQRTGLEVRTRSRGSQLPHNPRQECRFPVTYGDHGIRQPACANDRAVRLSKRFEQALTFATQKHAGQTRKGTEVPYVAHLLGVANIALTYGADEDEGIAALLHDAVEDQGGAETLREIRAKFGDRVAEIVEACSDTDVVPKPPWEERKKAYLAQLRKASPSVRLISAADKLDNARAILADYRALGERLWKRFNGGREGTLWYYRSLVEAYRQHRTTALVAELALVVAQIEQMAAARTHRDSERRKTPRTLSIGWTPVYRLESFSVWINESERQQITESVHFHHLDLPHDVQVASAEGYGWFHGETDNVTVYILRPDADVLKKAVIDGQRIVAEVEKGVRQYLENVAAHKGFTETWGKVIGIVNG